MPSFSIVPDTLSCPHWHDVLCNGTVDMACMDCTPAFLHAHCLLLRSVITASHYLLLPATATPGSWLLVSLFAAMNHTGASTDRHPPQLHICLSFGSFYYRLLLNKRSHKRSRWTQLKHVVHGLAVLGTPAFRRQRRNQARCLGGLIIISARPAHPLVVAIWVQEGGVDTGPCPRPGADDTG
jgi:hypothetical protein